MDMNNMDNMIIESVAYLMLQEIIDTYFNQYCEKHLSTGGTCDPCKFSFCNNELDCKAMYLKEALSKYNGN